MRTLRRKMLSTLKCSSGIPRMFDEFFRYGLSEPELVDMDGDFRVNFYRKSYPDKNVGKD